MAYLFCLFLKSHMCFSFFLDPQDKWNTPEVPTISPQPKWYEKKQLPSFPYSWVLCVQLVSRWNSLKQTFRSCFKVGEDWCFQSQRIHGTKTYLPTFTIHLYKPIVGQYFIHEAHGEENDLLLIRCPRRYMAVDDVSRTAVGESLSAILRREGGGVRWV